LRIFLISMAASIVTGCASEGARAVEPQTSAETVGSVRATAAAERDPAATDTPAADGGFVPPSGYHKRVHRGQTVYCKSETPVGTRFSRQYCFTEQELERIEANRRNVQREIDRARRGCIAGGDYCGGG
jgi:hypothetical protein